jgi:hypothetical protein
MSLLGNRRDEELGGSLCVCVCVCVVCIYRLRVCGCV